MRDKFIEAVRAGKSEIFSIDPYNPAMAYIPMGIYSPRGTRVRFTGYGGYDHDQKHARQHLNVGNIYTVESTDVGDWSTRICLQEVPGQRFNSVMFADDAPALSNGARGGENDTTA